MARNDQSRPAFCLYSCDQEKIKKLQETDEEIGKNEHIVAYLRAVRQMCQK